jgi:hypothetical protein
MAERQRSDKAVEDFITTPKEERSSKLERPPRISSSTADAFERTKTAMKEGVAAKKGVVTDEQLDKDIQEQKSASATGSMK